MSHENAEQNCHQGKHQHLALAAAPRALPSELKCSFHAAASWTEIVMIFFFQMEKL